MSDKDKPDYDRFSEDELWLKQSLRKHLDGQVDDIDFTVASKLSAARHRAIAQEPLKEQKTSLGMSSFNWTSALTSTAVLAMVAVVSSQLFRPSPLPEVEQAAQVSQDVFMEDIKLLSAKDDIEFYQSVEFLEWMENNSG